MRAPWNRSRSRDRIARASLAIGLSAIAACATADPELIAHIAAKHDTGTLSDSSADVAIDPSDAATPSSDAAPDNAFVDTAIPDASLPDEAVIDTAAPPDVVVDPVDAAVPDTAAPDTELPDTTDPIDTGPVDTGVPTVCFDDTDCTDPSASCCGVFTGICEAPAFPFCF